ncbi:MAG: site-specific integrase, partial [Lactococcus lactis]|nr:site-specific integrase [Lactococcus lactis]
MFFYYSTLFDSRFKTLQQNHSFRAGRRSYTIFQVGKATLLRVSDVMK